MLVSSTGNMLTTSSSSRLWQLVQFDSLLVEFILAATKSLPDYRLQSAALASRLLLEPSDNIDLESVLVRQSTDLVLGSLLSSGLYREDRGVSGCEQDEPPAQPGQDRHLIEGEGLRSAVQ